MKLIDKPSLIRLIRIRQKWHKDLSVDEVIEMIRQSPEVEIPKEDEDC